VRQISDSRDCPDFSGGRCASEAGSARNPDRMVALSALSQRIQACIPSHAPDLLVEEHGSASAAIPACNAVSMVCRFLLWNCRHPGLHFMNRTSILGPDPVAEIQHGPAQKFGQEPAYLTLAGGLVSCEEKSPISIRPRRQLIPNIPEGWEGFPNALGVLDADSRNPQSCHSKGHGHAVVVIGPD